MELFLILSVYKSRVRSIKFVQTRHDLLFRLFIHHQIQCHQMEKLKFFECVYFSTSSYISHKSSYSFF